MVAAVSWQGVVCGFCTDVDFPVVQHTNVQGYDRYALFVDRLGILAKITLGNSMATDRRNVGVEERGTPPLAILVFERCAVTEEATSEFARAIRTGDFVGNAVVEVIGALASLIGGPAVTKWTYFPPTLIIVAPS